MDMIIRTLTFFHFFLFFSAGWRTSSLFANELGPFHIFLYIRNHAKMAEAKFKIVKLFHLSEGLECEWCNSIWFGILFTFAWIAYGNIIMLFILPFAISTWVIVMKYFVEFLQQINGKEKVGTIIETIKRKEVNTNAISNNHN